MAAEWICGFSKKVITPKDYDTVAYYSAGYAAGCRCTEVLTDTYVRTLYLEAKNKRIVLAAVDCVGMSNYEVQLIRESLKSFIEETKTEINVCFTHCHSAPDTQGLWGKLPKSGRVESYNAFIRGSVVQTVMEAYRDRKSSKIFCGDIETEGLQEDTREPVVFDKKLTRLKIVPNDGSNQLYLIHYSVHPEMLGPHNPKISADFPSYMGEYIREKTDADYLFFNGAIGGQIVVPNLDGIWDHTLDNVEECKKIGFAAGRYATSIINEYELKPHIRYHRKQIRVPILNIKFVLAKAFKLINNCVRKVSKHKYGCSYVILSELAYMELGDLKCMLVPGELAPELAMGGYAPAELAANGYAIPEAQTIYHYMGGEGKKLIFGLANDEIGYILPQNDFYVHRCLPYILEGTDRHGIRHYCETNSTGYLTAEWLLDDCRKLIAEVKND